MKQIMLCVYILIWLFVMIMNVLDAFSDMRVLTKSWYDSRPNGQLKYKIVAASYIMSLLLIVVGLLFAAS